jgi:hypothetical protein
MTKYVQTQQDNGGVHINSGIPNNAAFLMASGGTNPTSKIEVTYGIGWEKAEKVWYRANTEYFTSSTNFAQAAQGTMQAAKDLGLTDNEQNIIDCAWKATGVVQGSCETLTDPAATAPETTPPDESGSVGEGSGGETTTDEATTGEEGDVGDEGTTSARKKRTLTPQASAGCHTASARGTSSGASVLAFTAVIGLMLSRRKRR